MHGTFRTLFTLGAAFAAMSLGLTGCTPLTQPSSTGSTPPSSKCTQPVSPEFALVRADGTEVSQPMSKASTRPVKQPRTRTSPKYSRLFDMKTAETAFVPLGVEASGAPVGLRGTPPVGGGIRGDRESNRSRIHAGIGALRGGVT